LEAQEIIGCELPPSTHGGAISDYGCAQTILDNHEVAESERKQRLDEACASAHEILYAQRDRLKNIAKILADKGCLDHQTIASLLSETKAKGNNE
jgi:hypothetical protein